MPSAKKGITVRFEDEEVARIDELAKRYEVSSATIIRWSLKALIDYVEVNDGKVILPLDFTEFYTTMKKGRARGQGVALLSEEPPEKK